MFGLLLACAEPATESAYACDAPLYTWENWGAGFFASYCTSCHLLLAWPSTGPTESLATAPSIFVALDDARLARRLSIDVRAKLPTEAELVLAAEPGGLAQLRESWLADPGLEEHLADLFAEEWVLRLDTLRIDPSESALRDGESWPYEDLDGVELATYHPEREMLATRILVEPVWFGTPVTAAGQLGPLVAADPRFPVCLARRATERWYGRPTTTAADAQVYELAGVLTSAWNYKDLMRAIVDTEEYRAGALTEAATDAQRAAHPVARVLSPNTLADLVEAVTGFRWVFEGADQVDEDLTGYRALMGGADGDSARVAWLEPSVGRSLAIGRLAQAAAGMVLEEDYGAAAAERRLLFRNGVEPADLVAGTAAFEPECQALHRRLHRVEATAEELAAETALFTEVEAQAGSKEAWATLVSVMMRDPLFWTY